MVIGVLFLFRFEELGVNTMKEMLNCGLSTPPALYALIDFLFDRD